MEKKVIYETKWRQKNPLTEYPHGWGFDAPLVIFSEDADPAWCNDYCKRYLSNDEFECIGATPRQLLNPFTEDEEDALSISEIKSLLDKEDWSKEDIATLLNSQKRQVKWLYNNSNKMTIVYEEKFVRLLLHKIDKIKKSQHD